RFVGARAVLEGAHLITSPADHRPNRVGNFTSTLLGKLRPTLTPAAKTQEAMPIGHSLRFPYFEMTS
ncbi:hypothetical protein LGM43_37310, partial [Burkholderia seminalis]|uniref:hypothetical protein n=1 Tax=Burkholderia seminalis TaxID=488731 RepID=UPI001CF1FD90